MFQLRREGPNGTQRFGDAALDGIVEAMTRGIDWMPPAAAEVSPSLDVTETATEWRVRIELPGVAPEDVEVTVTGNSVAIRGEKKPETKAEGENSRRAERRYGRFRRSLDFPTDLDAKKVEARAKNGVLHLTLPKAEAELPKTVQVRAE